MLYLAPYLLGALTGRAAPGPDPADVSASELIECPDAFDGVTVRYRGRLGAPYSNGWSGHGCNANDDPYALAAGPLPDHRTSLGGNSGLAATISIAAAPPVAHETSPRRVATAAVLAAVTALLGVAVLRSRSQR